jgi:HPt (histidine-containing phosphotransfer) domain-containing protein
MSIKVQTGEGDVAASADLAKDEEYSKRDSGTAGPIDMVHLQKQTMGDKVLEVEILQLFVGQSHVCLNEISSGDPTMVRAAAHRLKGAAGAIGAFRLMGAAEKLESSAGDPVCVAAVIAEMKEAENVILKLA